MEDNDDDNDDADADNNVIVDVIFLAKFAERARDEYMKCSTNRITNKFTKYHCNPSYLLIVLSRWWCCWCVVLLSCVNLGFTGSWRWGWNRKYSCKMDPLKAAR